MKSMNRRTFIKGTVLASAAMGLSARSWAQVAGANDTIRVAVIGFNSRGGDHLSNIQSLAAKGEKVKLVALCDADEQVLRKGVERFQKDGDKIQGYQDLRKLFENKDIDAVTIATPNHWHSLATIWAVQAGKDVYVEKPVSHNVWEGRKMVEAARKYGKIVQTGTQSRSSFAIRQAVQWVKDGNLGKIVVARGLCYKRRASIGKVAGPQPIPASVDYDLWCGPSPKKPLMRSKLHYDWHWVWDTGNGDVGNQGIHQMDIARWFLGETALAPAVISAGGRLGYVDDGETPNSLIVFHDYKKAPLIFEVRGLPQGTGIEKMDAYHGASVGVLIECEGGHVLIPDYNSATAFDKEGKQINKWSGSDNHYANFFKAVRSRKHEELNADISEGHISSALCHTGNISYRLGQGKSAEAVREKINAERDGAATYDRMLTHLQANGVDLKTSKIVQGEYLKMDAVKERFTNSGSANKLLTREYRKPFVVPEKV